MCPEDWPLSSPSLLHALAKVGSNTLLSRILGFVRDTVMAHVFGAGAGTDAFFVAFKIPNLLRRLFAEGSFSVAFVPVLTEYKEKRSYAELKDFVDAVSGTLGAVLLGVTLLGVVAAPLLVLISAPGFASEPGKADLATEMLRITFPYLLFISLTAFSGSILNAHNRFGIPAFTPTLLNLSMIAAALWLAPLMEEPVTALAWGVLIAGVAQLLFQVPFLRQLRLLPRFRFRPRDPGVMQVLRLMGPAVFGVSVTQLNMLLDTLIASFLPSGSISWLYYSDRLMEFPVGVLGVALGTVILPNLSRKHANESPQSFSATIDWALRWVLLLGVPSAVGLAVLSGPLISTLFLSDVFDATDVAMSQRSLIAYSFGLMPIILIKVLAPGFYARQDTRTPVRIGLIAMATNLACNLILVFPLGHAGLALATSLSAALNAALLFRGLRRDRVYRPTPGWFPLGWRVLVAVLAMGGVLLWAGVGLDAWAAMSRWERVGGLLGWIAAGAGIYFGILYLTGVRPRDFRHQRGG